MVAKVVASWLHSVSIGVLSSVYLYGNFWLFYCSPDKIVHLMDYRSYSMNLSSAFIFQSCTFFWCTQVYNAQLTWIMSTTWVLFFKQLANLICIRHVILLLLMARSRMLFFISIVTSCHAVFRKYFQLLHKMRQPGLIHVDGLSLCNDTEIGFDNRATGARETKWTITGKPNGVLYFITFIKHSVSPVPHMHPHNPPGCYARLA